MAIARVTHVFTAAAATNPMTAPSFNAVGGNLIAVIIRGTGLLVSGAPTDTAGNTYTLVGTNSSQDPAMWCYYAKNITGNASNVVSVPTGTPDSFAWVWVGQYSGLDTTAPLDTHDERASAGGGTDLTSNSITTATASELILLGVSQNNLTTYTAGTNFSLVDDMVNGSAQHYGAVEEFITSSTQSGAQHITSGVTNQYTTVVAAFKAAAAGGSFLARPNPTPGQAVNRASTY